MENKKSKGLGDSIEKITKATGIHGIVDQTLTSFEELKIVVVVKEEISFIIKCSLIKNK